MTCNDRRGSWLRHRPDRRARGLLLLHIRRQLKQLFLFLARLRARAEHDRAALALGFTPGNFRLPAIAFAACVTTELSNRNSTHVASETKCGRDSIKSCYDMK